MRKFSSLILLTTTLFFDRVLSLPSRLDPSDLQIPIISTDRHKQHNEKRRTLQGRFLQITDFHPDFFYKVYSSTAEDAACHRGQGPAGIYGAETSECDSPIALVNKTMEYVEKHFRDKVDFVIWTGDSARHDNDDKLPRSEKQVIELNEFMVQKMFEAFGKRNGDEEDEDPNNDFVVPIIPTLGNNDVLPHNIMNQGPSLWTRTYVKLWKHFIPEAQKHAFEQGGWFFQEVIPNKLAVFSLNTLYFFSSNAAADGCAMKSEPGYHQMEWLRIQLQFVRDRGMKAILIGHVPPARQEAKTQWDETCWQKYALWTRQFRDVIISSHYGHFNYDHFILQDFEDLRKDTRKGRMKKSIGMLGQEEDHDVEAQLKSDYWLQVRDDFAALPDPPSSIVHGKRTGSKKEQKYLDTIGGEYGERFSASFVSSSVVPNLFPTLRVFEYNITGLENYELDHASIPAPPVYDPSQDHLSDEEHDIDIEKKKKKKHKKKKGKNNKEYKFKVPAAPASTSPPGPAYSPQPLSLIRYTQYAANLTRINNDFVNVDGVDTELDAAKWHEGKHKGKKPHERDHMPNPKKFTFDVYYDTRDDEVYHLPDLTMRSLIDLATRIGDFVEEDEVVATSDVADQGEDGVEVGGGKKRKKQREVNKAWYTFIERVFVGTKSADEIEAEFG